jgi:hypothetical protein
MTIIEPLAGFTGIWVAFKVESKASVVRFTQRVREIFPYIYFELTENAITLQETDYHAEDQYLRHGIRFKTVNWNLFKNEVAKWREINVIPLTRINHYLEKINEIYNREETATWRGLRSRIKEAHNLLHKASISIHEQIAIYDKWIEKNPAVLQQFKKAFERYEETSNQDRLMTKAVTAILQKKYMTST